MLSALDSTDTRELERALMDVRWAKGVDLPALSGFRPSVREGKVTGVTLELADGTTGSLSLVRPGERVTNPVSSMTGEVLEGVGERLSVLVETPDRRFRVDFFRRDRGPGELLQISERGIA